MRIQRDLCSSKWKDYCRQWCVHLWVSECTVEWAGLELMNELVVCGFVNGCLELMNELVGGWPSGAQLCEWMSDLLHSWLVNRSVNGQMGE